VVHIVEGLCMVDALALVHDVWDDIAETLVMILG
jgi:hypothetical protein